MLINGDCLEKMKDLSDNSVDIIIADLPYGRFKNLDWDKKIDLEKMWKEIWRVCKIRAPVFLFGDFKFANILINSNPKDFKYEIVWEKPSPTNFLNMRKMLGRSTEYILVFYKKLPVYNYLKYHKKMIKGKKVEMKNKKIHSNLGNISKNVKCMGGRVHYEPRLPTNVIKSGNIVDFGLIPTMKHITRTQSYYEPRLPTNVIRSSQPRQKKLIPHITEKPQKILEFLLKYFSNEGDVCLDITMGSGSMGVACKTLGREFIGIELNKEHFEAASKRLND